MSFRTRIHVALALFLIMLSALSCSTPATLTDGPEAGLPTSSPETEGVSLAKLTELTEWVRTDSTPIFSILISRHGKLVYELYTSQLSRDHAHYLMSVTKSFLSSLVGVALDRGLINSTDETVADALPRSWFANDADDARMQTLTLKDVMGMSALDCSDPPRDMSSAALERQKEFINAPNRAAIALSRPLLADFGKGFQYNDENPEIIAAVVASATGEAPFDFANETLFGPMGFQNQEWMQEDVTGNDLGGFGLRLRPIDMLKFGNLYLNQGAWNGSQLLSSQWIQTSFTPWNTSSASLIYPNYGWFWWKYLNSYKWPARMANGWRGQRIFIFPDQEAVVAITADIEDGSEVAKIAKIMNTWILPAIQSSDPFSPSPEAEQTLADLMKRVRSGNPRWSSSTELRMIPSIGRKERGRRPFNPPTD